MVTFGHTIAYGAPLFPRRQCRVGQKDRNESKETEAAAWLSGSTAVLTTATDLSTDLVVGGAVEVLDEVDLAFVHLEPAQLDSGAQP
jgi:hypothetical protein